MLMEHWNMTIFLFLFQKEYLFWIWVLRVPIFEGPKSVCPFHQYGPSKFSCLLLVLHSGTLIVHFNRLKAWFYVNSTLKYFKVFVFYSPKEYLFWIWLLWVPVFEGPKSVWPFHQHGPRLLNGVLLVMNFDTPKVNFKRLEAWFYLNVKIVFC